MAYDWSRARRRQKSEIRGRRSEIISDSEIRISKIVQSSIRHLQFAHIRSSLSVLDLLQHLFLETLADGIDQNFLTDPFDKLLKLGFGETI
jgi:hypothetical protein